MWLYWNTKTLTSEAMTHAGWRYAPIEQHRAAVECPFRDLKLCNWIDGHDPLCHHQKHLPNCPCIRHIYLPVKQSTITDLITELHLIRRVQEQVSTRLTYLEVRSPPSETACITPVIAPVPPRVQPTLRLQPVCQDESDAELLEEDVATIQIADELSRSLPQSTTVKP